MGVQPVQLLAHIGALGEEGHLLRQPLLGDLAAHIAIEQGGEVFEQPGALGMRLAHRLTRGLGAESGDVVEQGGEDKPQPLALRRAGRDQPVERAEEGGQDGGVLGGLCRLIGFGGFGPQHAGQGEQRLGTGRLAAGNAGCHLQRQGQHAIQRGAVQRQGGARLQLQGEAGLDIAALEAFARGVTQGRFQRIHAAGQAQADIEAPAIHAAQFPDVMGAIRRQHPALAGEAGHAGQGGHQAARAVLASTSPMMATAWVISALDTAPMQPMRMLGVLVV